MISLFINELPTLTAFGDKDRVLVDSIYTVAAEMSALRDYVLTSRVIPSMSATNLIVSNLSALSSTFVTLDVINYELSGFNVTGELTISPNSLYPYALRTDSTSGAITLPVGTTGQRPDPARQGALRFNTTDNTFEGHNGTEWGALGETTADVFVDEPAGNILAGETVPKGTSLQDLVNNLFIKTFFPTKIDPSASTSFSLDPIVEAGTTNLTITINYDDGVILGRTTTWNPPSNVSGVWNPSTIQSSNYAGAASVYTINGVNNGASSSRNFPSQQIIDGTNNFNSSVTLLQGPIPYDSKGGNYSVTLPRYNGGSISTSGSIAGARKVWYGLNLASVTEANIRAYTTFKWSTSNTAGIEVITLSIPPGAQNVFFAVPDDVVRTPTVIESTLNVDVFTAFTLTPSFTIRGANNYTGSRSTYKVYVFDPPTDFENAVTYTITI